MSMLQKFIKEFNENKNADTYARIIAEIQSAQKLWIAYSPATNNYFLGNINGKATAYLFSERDFYDVFYVHESQKGYSVAVTENGTEHRMMLFADLYRSGFEAVIIDNGQYNITINIFDIIKKPQQPEENKDARLIMNPSLVRTACWFFQENDKQGSTPSQEMWQRLFSEVLKGEYIVPADTSKLKVDGVQSGEIKVDRNSEVAYPIIKHNDGKKYYTFFTDWNELRRFDITQKYSAILATFNDFSRFSVKADGIVINPFGANIILTSEMLNDIKEIAANFENKKSEIMVGEPKEYPVAMVRTMTESMSGMPEINAAYLKLMVKDGNRSYLVGVDFETENNTAQLFDQISEKALPFANEIPIDYISYKTDFAQRVFRNSEPFYKKS